MEILENEALLRMAFFLSALTIFSLMELKFPRRSNLASQMKRWAVHFGLVSLSSIFVRIIAMLMPLILPVNAAYFMIHQDFGLFHLIKISFWIEVLLCLIIFDGMIYIQHLVFHRISFFWHLHSVHHLDPHIDTTSALRFHPLEILISSVFKSILVLFLGAHPVSVIAFEILLNGCSLFNHANIYIPTKIERMIRVFFVTPDMHRIHHSRKLSETHSNFGFCLSLWDIIFSTYRKAPSLGHIDMKIGHPQISGDRVYSFIRLLLLPWKG